jgi:hypothetical protein
MAPRFGQLKRFHQNWLRPNVANRPWNAGKATWPMPQIFHPSMNTIARVSIFGAAFIAAFLGWVLWLYYRSSYHTQVGVVRPQPVEFSHEHHVGGLGIDCRYCHMSVEASPFAGVPSTEICMNCHSQIWRDSPKLELVRASFRNGESIRWTRVHDLPDFVYFDHSIHVAKGVGCVSCHGRVDAMPLIWRAQSLDMRWCVGCHRDPEAHLRSRNLVYSLEPMTDVGDGAGSRAKGGLMAAHQIKSETDCSTCHR